MWVPLLVAMTAVGAEGRFEPSCACALTRDAGGWTGAVPLASLTSIVHVEGSESRDAAGLLGALADGSRVRLALGSTDVVTPVLAEITSFASIPVVDENGGECAHLHVRAPSVPPGGWTSRLVAFDGGGQVVQDVATLIRQKAESLRTCLDEGDRTYATEVTLDFAVARSGDFDHVEASGGDLDASAAACMARRIAGWRTSGIQRDNATYRWTIRLPGIPR